MELTLITKLLGFRTAAHWIHWQTTSYSEHKALDEFYSELGSLTDEFIETYFGKYGRIDGTFINAINIKEPLELVNSVYLHMDTLEAAVDKKDTDLHNIIADIRQLCNHTKYLLTLK